MSERNERPAWQESWERDREQIRGTRFRTQSLDERVAHAYRLGFEAGLRATGQAADNLGDALLRLIGGTTAEPKGEG